MGIIRYIDALDTKVSSFLIIGQLCNKRLNIRYAKDRKRLSADTACHNAKHLSFQIDQDTTRCCARIQIRRQQIVRCICQIQPALIGCDHTIADRAIGSLRCTDRDHRLTNDRIISRNAQLSDPDLLHRCGIDLIFGNRKDRKPRLAVLLLDMRFRHLLVTKSDIILVCIFHRSCIRQDQKFCRIVRQDQPRGRIFIFKRSLQPVLHLRNPDHGNHKIHGILRIGVEILIQLFILIDPKCSRGRLDRFFLGFLHRCLLPLHFLPGNALLR